MNELKVFENAQFGKVRVVFIDNEPWLVAKDVAEVLGYVNPSKAISDHVDEEDLKTLNFKAYNESLLVKTLWQDNDFSDKKLINESGLYSLIMSSKIPKAKAFKRWVTSEVLPSIRQTGGYGLKYRIPQTFSEALRLAATQQETIEQLELEKQSLELENKSLEPKAAYFDRLVDDNLLTNFRDTAKEFNLGQKEFIEWLIDNNFIYRDQQNELKPYMIHHNKGLFELKEWQKPHKSGVQTLVTPRGRETFRMILS